MNAFARRIRPRDDGESSGPNPSVWIRMGKYVKWEVLLSVRWSGI